MDQPTGRIEVDPRVHAGQPIVAGTRIPVQAVLELVAEGIPFAEIVRDYVTVHGVMRDGVVS